MDAAEGPLLLNIGLCSPLPPAIVGLLAAWATRAGRDVKVVQGGFPEGDLWVALEPGFSWEALQGLGGVGTFFGPALADEEVAHRLMTLFPQCRIEAGDPVPGTLEDRPIATWAGFDLGGARRVLAGNGVAARPLGLLLRELVYSVEMGGVGLFFFDDADLAAYPGWLDAFEAELARLPWDLGWEGTVASARRTGGRLT